MALRMVSRFYTTYEAAVQAVADLTAAGVRDVDVSLIGSEDDARLPPGVAHDAAQPPASTGAKLGMGIGGGVGVLFGVGALSSTLLDPLAALGWWGPTLVGAAIGAVIGAVVGVATGMGVTTRQAHGFAEGLQRGEHLVMVSVEEQQVAMIEGIMARTHPPLPAETPQTSQGATAAAERSAIRREEDRIEYTSK